MSKVPTVPIGPLEHIHLSISRHPGTTLFSVITNAFGSHAHGMPPAWRQAVRDGAPPQAAATLRALLTTGHPWAPDCLALTGNMRSGPEVSVADELDGIEPDRLVAEVENRFGDAVPAGWRHVADRPRAFLAGYRDLARSVWDTFGPLWQQADGLLMREVERIGVASVTGVLGTVLNGLGSPVRYGDGLLHLPHPCPGHLTGPGRRRLVLVPLASGLSACTYSAEDPDFVWIGYPLPGLGRLITRRCGEPEPRSGRDRLDLVLGPVRAAILRHARRRPSVSEAARLAHVTVSTATYHCGQLAQAGLLRRLRHGREVRLHLTDNGAALLDLLA
ncbi:hypothetical protein QWM81_04465 [Streptomyces ficellus]|uniref:ArsR family transcriptional regulator n=1 Tax=Streptomyces ficellus TaxID=1977088 RepID=A0ABT7Z1E2_9ACTN|nr:hypothetical protein [Streptomyces ficellus]MDN3293314.1 hypothetical protein [Streptomyces ficellus]